MNSSNDLFVENFKCIYCNVEKLDLTTENWIRCTSCSATAHFTCLTENVRVPDYSLLGDVFYKFTCRSCSPLGEQVVKEKISWLTALVLALYNLQEQIYLSRHGYFHWKHHIAEFIEKKWLTIFGRGVRRKKNWMGTVSGTLSHHSPMFFQTGTEELQEAGWWRLTHSNLTPYQTIQLRLGSNAAQSLKKSIPKSEEAEDTEKCNNNTNPEAHPSPVQEHSSPKSSLDLDILNYSDSESLNMDIDLDISIDDYNKPFPSSGFLQADWNFCDLVGQDVESEEVVISEENNESKNATKSSKTYSGDIADFDSEQATSSESDDDENSNECYPAPKSLFNPSQNRPWPWVNKARETIAGCEPMTEYEELKLIQRIKTLLERDVDVPCEVLRLYRKLCVRQMQRHNRLPTFDGVLAKACGTQSPRTVESHSSVRTLDRYQVMGCFTSNQHTQLSSTPFILRLLGRIEPTSFVSPYTERLLKPFIWRNFESKPLWLCLMEEIQERGIRKNLTKFRPPKYPIDFSYVRPQHIPTINSLCELYFWPGIDLTESLMYPDFSCVALYRKIIIGFAFMVPDAGCNESYISFLFTRPEWRRAGIATFMLYHLIQTCMGKDITLHVSVTNPAVILYQKFGFKVEELAQDFYDKYLPSNSNECKHALFLRLSR